jgi:hypothetical protein
MKLTVTMPVDVSVYHIWCIIPVRYQEDEELPMDAPFRRKWQTGDGEHNKKLDMWEVQIDIDTGMISRWPQGKTLEFDTKVCDSGKYVLPFFGAGLFWQERVLEDYAPCCIPDGGGDYVSFHVDADGRVANWERYCTAENIREAFFKQAD